MSDGCNWRDRVNGVPMLTRRDRDVSARTCSVICETHRPCDIPRNGQDRTSLVRRPTSNGKDGGETTRSGRQPRGSTSERMDQSSRWTAEEEFYALGESDWQDFFQEWRQYGVGTESCLEIGCGPGRITRHLARSFHSVRAVDVSVDMIEYACRRAKAQNTSYLVVQGVTLPLRDRSVKAISQLTSYSTWTALGWPGVLSGIFRVLDEGGTILYPILPLCTSFQPNIVQLGGCLMPRGSCGGISVASAPC